MLFSAASIGELLTLALKRVPPPLGGLDDVTTFLTVVATGHIFSPPSPLRVEERVVVK